VGWYLARSRAEKQVQAPRAECHVDLPAIQQRLTSLTATGDWPCDAGRAGPGPSRCSTGREMKALDTDPLQSPLLVAGSGPRTRGTSLCSGAQRWESSGGGGKGSEQVPLPSLTHSLTSDHEIPACR